MNSQNLLYFAILLATVALYYIFRRKTSGVSVKYNTPFLNLYTTDLSFERRFQPIEVKEPTPEETLLILQGVKDKYREYHKLSSPMPLLRRPPW